MHLRSLLNGPKSSQLYFFIVPPTFFSDIRRVIDEETIARSGAAVVTESIKVSIRTVKQKTSQMLAFLKIQVSRQPHRSISNSQMCAGKRVQRVPFSFEIPKTCDVVLQRSVLESLVKMRIRAVASGVCSSRWKHFL